MGRSEECSQPVISRAAEIPRMVASNKPAFVFFGSCGKLKKTPSPRRYFIKHILIYQHKSASWSTGVNLAPNLHLVKWWMNNLTNCNYIDQLVKNLINQSASHHSSWTISAPSACTSGVAFHAPGASRRVSTAVGRRNAEEETART